MNKNTTFEDPMKLINSQRTIDVGSVVTGTQADSNDRKNKGKVVNKKRVQGQADPNAIIWQLPFGLCKFIEDIYNQYTEVSVIVWPTFKMEIFQLFEERLNSEWEIHGSPTNSVIPFEEFIILYFVRKTTHLRLAGLKLLEFIASLRYYAERWKRAYICSILCNLIRRRDFGIFDYYIQNYVLFLYSRLTHLKEYFYEGTDGGTYLHQDRLFDMLYSALEFLDATRFEKEKAGILLKARPVDEKENMIDIDDVMHGCLELFLEVGIGA